MSVKAECEKGQNLLATDLNVTAGEYLVYEVSFRGAQPLFTIVDQHGVIVMDPKDKVDAGTFRKKWPAKKSDVKIPDDLNHTLSMSFIAAVEYDYVVTMYSKAGKKVEVCKNCSYSSTTSTDTYHVPLRIFTA